MDVFRVETANGVLDVYENTHEEFYATLQINDLFSLNTREATFSKVLNLPMSPKNEQLLNIDFNTANKNQEIECQIIIDGVPVAYDAGLVVLEYNDDNIEVAFLFGNFNFFTLIPDTGLGQLDFSEYNFYLDLAGFAALGQLDEGVTTGICSWYEMSSFAANGLSQPTNHFYYTQDILVSGFGLYGKTILKKLVESVGYTLDDSRVSNLDLYNNTVILCPMLQFMEQVIEGTIFARVLLTAPQTAIGTTLRLAYTADVDPTGIWNDPADQFDIGVTNVYNISLYYDGSYLNDTGNGNYGQIRILINGVTAIQDEYNSTQSISGTLSLVQTLNAGDVVHAEIEGRYKNPSQQDEITITNSIFTVSTNVTPASRDIIVADQIPYMSQRTFLTSFLSLFNGFLQADDLSKTVEISYFDEILTAETIDYSDNIDDSRKGKAITAPPNYFQESLMQYQGADSLIRDDVNLVVNFDNEAMQVAGVVLDIQFYALDQTLLYDNIIATTGHYSTNLREQEGLNANIGSTSFTLDNPVDFKENDFMQLPTETYRIATKTSDTSGTIAGTFNGTLVSQDWSLITFSPNQKPIQICYVDKVNTDNLDIMDGDWDNRTTFITYGFTFPEALTMRGVYNAYYENLFEALNTPMIIEVWMYFSATQLLEIDFLKPVYIKQLSHYFYINKVEQWKVNQLCRVQLVRINKLIDEDLKINRQI